MRKFSRDEPKKQNLNGDILFQNVTMYFLNSCTFKFATKKPKPKVTIDKRSKKIIIFHPNRRKKLSNRFSKNCVKHVRIQWKPEEKRWRTFKSLELRCISRHTSSIPFSIPSIRGRLSVKEDKSGSSEVHPFHFPPETIRQLF